MKDILNRKTTKIGIAAIILAIAIGVAGMNVRSAQRQQEYDGHMEAAQRYLAELDYEQAIVEYTLALEIEPKAEEAMDALEQTYLDYAQSLADAGDYGKAASVLEEGYAKTGRESLREKLEELKSLQAQREAEEEEMRRLEEEQAAGMIELPFELTDFNVMGYDLFDYHGAELCEAIGCPYERENGMSEILMESESGTLYADNVFSGAHEAVGISCSVAQGDHYEAGWSVTMVWNLDSHQSASMEMYHDGGETIKSISDYIKAPIVAGVSSWEDWNRIMQVDRIKALEPDEEYSDDNFLCWRFQTNLGEGTYDVYLSEETGEETAANLRIDSDPGSADSFVYEIFVNKGPDGMIRNCNVSYY